MHVCMLSLFSHVLLFATLRTADCQVPLTIIFHKVNIQLNKNEILVIGTCILTIVLRCSCLIWEASACKMNFQTVTLSTSLLEHSYLAWIFHVGTKFSSFRGIPDVPWAHQLFQGLPFILVEQVPDTIAAYMSTVALST